MELLSPAGNIEKLRYAYAYGADAAYIGLKRFSLRVKADNFYDDEYTEIAALKERHPGKKLYCALNISFHNSDLDHFLGEIDYFKLYPIDAFIVQDLGIVPILQKHFPAARLHLSTQASCINREAVKMYRSLGFSRVVLGREASLAEIREIKDAVPEMELECFAHGAMCIAYSGRCLMSAYLTGRSANAGFCSHTCRWNYALSADLSSLGSLSTNGALSVLGGTGTAFGSAGTTSGTGTAFGAPTPATPPLVEPPAAFSPEAARALAQSGHLALSEYERPGEYFPVIEGDDFTAILSSKDLCMVDHLDDMRAAGVDSLKIEGRMKSLYYVAMTTRAYRKALDALEGRLTAEEARPFVDELYHAAHREFATGFFYSREDADKTTVGESTSDYELTGTVGAPLTDEEARAVLAAGDRLAAAFQAELDAMHPKARAAKDEDLCQHPEKRPHPASPAVDLAQGRLYAFSPLNRIEAGAEIEYVGPDIIAIKDRDFALVDPDTGCALNWVSHHHRVLLYTRCPIGENYIVRTRIP